LIKLTYDQSAKKTFEIFTKFPEKRTLFTRITHGNKGLYQNPNKHLLEVKLTNHRTRFFIRTLKIY